MSKTDEKQRLRADLRGRREKIEPSARAALSRQACARALALPEFDKATTVAGYVAIRAEADPAAVLDAAWSGRRTVALPRVGRESPGLSQLTFHRVDRGAVLVDAAFGLREPDAGWPEVAAEDVDLFIVPGLAFDASGRRLGWGGGYYDEVGRRVRAAGRGLLVGFAYDFQVVERVPAGPGDVAVHCIVTDARAIRCESAR